jgi:hypothetical protein
VLKVIQKIFAVGYSGTIILFTCCGLALIFFAALEFWHGIDPGLTSSLPERFNSVLEAIGLLTIAVVALELGQTVLEEEVMRNAQVSAPTRVRRFLSRFMLVVVVALAIESLVTVFEMAHGDATRLPHAASIAVAAGVLLAAWGFFIRMNKSAEELEPEEMAQAKSEDSKLK